MNIKKSPLMAGLLSLSAVFGSMTGKAEAPKYKITHEDMGNMFTNQTEVASFQVNGVDVHVMTGWSKKHEWIDEKDGYQTRILTAPFIVGKNGSAFTGAFANMPTDISAVAVNEENGRAYAFKAGYNQDFYELNFGTNNVTSTEPLQVLHQLRPSVTAMLGFHSENSETSEKFDTKVDRAIVWTDPNYTDNRDFILIYDRDAGEYSTTQIWHRNGVVNQVDEFSGIEPVDVLKGQNVIYYGNLANNQLVSISKSNPTAGARGVNLRSDGVGVGVIGDTLYQATSNGIFAEGDQQPMNMWNGENGWRAEGGISHMISNGGKLIIAYNANATSVAYEDRYKDIQLENGVDVVAVKGASKVEARRDGIYALIQNQMQKVR